MMARVVPVVAMGMFLSALSSSSVGVVLPGIGRWAGLGVAEVSLVNLVQLLAICVVLLPAGKVGDRVGQERVYILGALLMALGSTLCLIAPNLLILLSSRALQGVGAGFTMASGPALITLSTRRERRGTALGAASSALYLGLTLGPVLGGWLDEMGGFRAVFAAQVVFSIALATICFFSLPKSQIKTTSLSIDWTGAVLLALALILLVIILARSSQVELSSWWPLTLLGGALVGALFVVEQRRQDPILDLALFRNRTFASAVAGAFLNYAAMFHASFLLPFYLEDLRGLDPGHAGTFMAIMPVVMALTSTPSGTLSDRFGSRLLSSAGMLILGTGLFLLSRVGQTTPLLLVGLAMAIIGLGTGLFITPNTSALMSSAPGTAQGSASGIMALSRNLGMLGGTALSAAVHEIVTDRFLEAGKPLDEAVVTGFGAAWIVGATLAAIGALVVLIRSE